MKKIILIGLLLSTPLMAEEKKEFVIQKASEKVGVAGYYLGDVIPSAMLKTRYVKTDDHNEFLVPIHSFSGYTGLRIDTTPNTNKIYSIILEKDRVVCSKEAKRTADILSSNFKKPYKTSISENYDSYTFDYPNKRVFVSCFAYGYNNKLYFFDDKLIEQSKQEGIANVKKRDDYWNSLTNIKK